MEGLEVIPVKTLVEAVGFYAGKLPIEPFRLNIAEVLAEAATEYEMDFADVKGQEHVKRGLTRTPELRAWAADFGLRPRDILRYLMASRLISSTVSSGQSCFRHFV